MKTIQIFKYSFLIFLFYFNEVCANCIKQVVFLRHGEKNSVAAGLINCQGENRALGLANPTGNLLNTYGTPAAIYAANPNVTYPDKGCYPNGCCLYHRPYLTISPTAILLQVPINTNFGPGYLGDISTTNGPVIDCSSIPTPDIEYLKLPIPPSPPNICGSGNTNGDADLARDILKNNNYCGKTIFVAWEHNNIPVVTYNFFKFLGLNAYNKIPVWPYGVCVPSYVSTGICKNAELGQCSRAWNFDSLYVVTIDQSNPYSPSISIDIRDEDLNYPSTTCPTV